MTDPGVRGGAEGGEGVCPCQEKGTVEGSIFGLQDQRHVSRVGVWVEGVKVESAGGLMCVLMMGHSTTSVCAQLGGSWACWAGTSEV